MMMPPKSQLERVAKTDLDVGSIKQLVGSAGVRVGNLGVPALETAVGKSLEQTRPPYPVLDSDSDAANAAVKSVVDVGSLDRQLEIRTQCLGAFLGARTVKALAFELQAQPQMPGVVQLIREAETKIAQDVISFIVLSIP